VFLCMDIIQDIRLSDQFKVFTFSKYQKSSVKKEWISSMLKENVEASCYWTTELICSGLFNELWELIIFFYAKHIHGGNPKIPAYLVMRFDQFKQEAIQVTNEMELRNNMCVRKIMTEIICVLCKSKKQNSYDVIDIGKDIVIVKSKLIAPTIEYNKGFKPNDPKELFIPINELGYAIFSKNHRVACYWIEWILLFLHKQKCKSIERTYHPKYTTDGIWIVWDTLYAYSPTPLSKKILDSLLRLFTIAYTPAVKEKRRFLLYYAVSACCDPISMDNELIQDKKLIELSYEKCWIMYKEIRKHEIS
jgi:hypothetical protein